MTVPPLRVSNFDTDLPLGTAARAPLAATSSSCHLRVHQAPCSRRRASARTRPQIATRTATVGARAYQTLTDRTRSLTEPVRDRL
ncbi:MAG: hypothetical protein AVDCRST_MAG19-55 [uncultured Thermomicrobiales bacterium]|uniref:Uncharacterized protein n=1 Tax=uncultured Thermomicrobiales bacterium TaxID=1645740 RepID=A0A6J4U9Y7_9BACT|nr:MAG: hypothetical protein AVDCRST_MAG19-55 [uncultured Thermomicrobiales bacterium]